MAGPFNEDNFGDGSNRWVPGFIETVRNPIDRLTNPYDTIAGAADAAALNFDEGVGGITSLFGSRQGNTAGPGESPWLASPEEGQPENPTRDTPLSGAVWAAVVGLVTLVVVYTVGQLFTINIG